jgi:glycosyltransferase involved in cell wall biosynthesis
MERNESMKIISIVRTLNEERNIARYCETHQDIADEIFIADGGSEDKTIEIAKTYPNVKIKPFTERMELENGLWRNPDWKHINFLIEWAESENPDWIIFNDCDTTPNKELQKDTRTLLEETDKSIVMTVSLFLFGEGLHFPHLAKPGKHIEYQPGMWGWRRSEQIRAVGETLVPHFLFARAANLENSLDFDKEDCLRLMPPYCRLHRNCQTEELTKKRVNYYRESGLIPGMVDPMNFGGGLEPLPEWAVD